MMAVDTNTTSSDARGQHHGDAAGTGHPLSLHLSTHFEKIFKSKTQGQRRPR